MLGIVNRDKFFLETVDGEIKVINLEKTYWRVKCKKCNIVETFFSLTAPVLSKCRHCGSEELVFKNYE